MPLRMLVEHDRDEGVDPMDHTPEVDTKNPFPALERLLPRRYQITADTCVVAEDMDCPKHLEGLLGERLNLLGLRDIGQDTHHSGTLLPHLAFSLGEDAFFNVSEDNLHVRCREPLRQCTSDSAGCPSNDGDLPCKC